MAGHLLKTSIHQVKSPPGKVTAASFLITGEFHPRHYFSSALISAAFMHWFKKQGTALQLAQI